MEISLTVFITLFIATLQVEKVSSSDYTKLLNWIFTNNSYVNDLRPVCGEDQTIEVKVGLAVRQIIDLDEPKQILRVNAWLRLNWFDCQLQWNSSHFGDIETIVLPFSKLWAPDITLYDNAAANLEGIKDYLIKVNNAGSCTYNFPTVIEALCKIDVTYFPFDTQICPLKFGSWIYNGFEISVANRSVAGDASSFVANTEWNLLEIPLLTNKLFYSCCEEPYYDVTFFVTLKRKPLFYVLNLVFPCILITAVALLGFLLPPDAGEKVSLEITVLLSLAVFLLVVSETLPASSENFPYIGIYFAMTMMLVSLSTLLTVIVLNVHHRGNHNIQVPKWLKILVLRYLSRLVCVNTDSSHVFPEPEDLAKFTKKMSNANGVDNNGFTSETFINGFKDSQTKDISLKSSSLNGGYASLRNNEFSDSSSSQINNRSSSFNPSDPSLRRLIDILKQQVTLMEKTEARKEGKYKHDHLSAEWKKVAVVLDRFFLIISCVILSITTLAIFLQLSVNS